MREINYKAEVWGDLESIVDKVTDALKEEGFGVLNRIDFHTKVKEKLGKDLPPTVILGACNPQLAYDAYLHNSDVASLLPCNAVIRETKTGYFSVELAKPTELMRILDDEEMVALALDADERLKRVVDSLPNHGSQSNKDTSHVVRV